MRFPVFNDFLNFPLGSQVAPGLQPEYPTKNPEAQPNSQN